MADLILPDGARHAPATLRNRHALLSVLRASFARKASILEIASGTGEHGHFFTSQQPGWRWQPSDPDAAALASIESWRGSAPAALAPPIMLDVCDPHWPAASTPPYDGVFCANMIHIAPPEATVGLCKCAAAQLRSGGIFVLYGPFMMGGEHSAPSNAAFDESLKARDPAWGIRDLGDVVDLARRHQLVHQKTHAMPANNLCLVFHKTQAAPTSTLI
ncbi:MAG: DUF938 domain-containing protein [Pseudomonadota bacterium]